MRLDVTRDDEVAAAAAACPDVSVLINNAGIARPGGLLAPDGLASLQAHLDTNLFGPLRLSRAFAPVLAAQGGGAVLNVLSLLSWINTAQLSAYAVSKTAAWGLSNGLRNEWQAQGTQVLNLHMGYVDTDLTRGFEVDKTPPEQIARLALDALEAGAGEVLGDALTRQVKQGLSAEPAVYLG